MLVHITPALPPATSGVGDYSALLAEQLTVVHGVESAFFLGSDGTRASSLRHVLDEQATTVLLQYSGYGYSAKGCPSWLVGELERWRAARPSRRIVTIFHELAADGKPWQSSFWLRPLQQSLVKRLARITDSAITSRTANKREILRLLGSASLEIEVLPVFSNVGEPERNPAFANREDALVVFGTPGRRIEVYKKGAALIEATCKNLGLKFVFDIGPRTEVPAAVGGATVVPCGELSPEDAGRRLASAKAGMIDYPADILGKSGIFAAYAAHGLAPVLLSPPSLRSEDGLVSGEHYFFNEAPRNNEEAEAAGRRVRTWYQGHPLAAHAALISRFLTRSGDDR